MGVAKTERAAVTGYLMQTANTKTADVVIISRNNDAAFRDLVLTLRQDSRMRVVAEFPTLSAALQAGLGQTSAADFVVVLQSYSDEYAADQINDFIGRLLFARIVVCYGPWCTADGRSHELWPVAFRIPVASAAALIELELAAFLTGDQPLFPMSAGEEVFAHRSMFPSVMETASRRQAIVVSDDVQIRRTVSAILNELNFECAAVPMLVPIVRSYLDSNARAVSLAVIDLDGPRDNIDACLDLLHNEFHIRQVSGMSVFAASLAKSDGSTVSPIGFFGVSELIEKTELLSQLPTLQRLLS